MTTIGCPKLCPTQVFFVDFNTGTSMDNLYILTSVNESIGLGKYECSLQFGYQEGYARYYSPTQLVDVLKQEQAYMNAPREAEDTTKPNNGKKK